MRKLRAFLAYIPMQKLRYFSKSDPGCITDPKQVPLNAKQLIFTYSIVQRNEKCKQLS